jgi:hypothetical protein
MLARKLIFLLSGFPKDVFFCYILYILGLSHMKWLEFLVVAGLEAIPAQPRPGPRNRTASRSVPG